MFIYICMCWLVMMFFSKKRAGDWILSLSEFLSTWCRIDRCLCAFYFLLGEPSYYTI